jgi:hypothetical protein
MAGGRGRRVLLPVVALTVGAWFASSGEGAAGSDGCCADLALVPPPAARAAPAKG